MHTAPIQPTLTTLRVRALTASVCCFLLACVPSCNVHAIDSLLEQAAKHEKEQVKKVSKGKAAAIFTMKSGEVVACVWLARAGEDFRYQRVSDGKLVATPQKDIERVEGEVLDKTPESEVVVHVMHCNGEYCKPTVKTIHIPVWPKD